MHYILCTFKPYTSKHFYAVLNIHHHIIVYPHIISSQNLCLVNLGDIGFSKDFLQLLLLPRFFSPCPPRCPAKATLGSAGSPTKHDKATLLGSNSTWAPLTAVPMATEPPLFSGLQVSPEVWPAAIPNVTKAILMTPIARTRGLHSHLGPVADGFEW